MVIKPRTRLCLVAGLLTLLLGTGLAQTSFERSYSLGMRADGCAAQQTADGGYVVAGQAVPDISSDVWLLRISAHGDTLWTRTYGGPAADAAFSVQQTLDGGYIVCGSTRSYGAGDQDVWLLKTNAQGDTQWTRTYGGTLRDYGRSVKQTSDSGYIVAGTTRSFGAGRTDVWLLKTDANGGTLWTRTFGDATDEEGYSVVQTSDGGYILAGTDEPIGSYMEDILVIRTDARGDTLWIRTFGDTSVDRGYSVIQALDDRFLVASITSSFGGEYAWLIKCDSTGESLWTRLYAGDYSCGSMSVAQTADSGYALAGYRGSLPQPTDVWLARTDAWGDTLWTRTFGGPFEDVGRCVAPAADGGFIVTGYRGLSLDSSAVYLIKTDPDGHVGLAEPRAPSARGPRPTATICRGVLQVDGRRQNGDRLELLDIAGRKVLDLKPGPNDARCLAPGIYFVRRPREPGPTPAKVLVLD